MAWKLGSLFKVINDNAVKVTLRSAGKVDVAALAQTFGGGGHVRQQDVVWKAHLDDIVAKVLKQVKSQCKAI